MKRKKSKRRPNHNLRQRIAAFASEKIQPAKILKVNENPPVKEADLAVQEFEFEGKPHIKYPLLSLEGGQMAIEAFRMGLERGMEGHMQIKKKPSLTGRVIAKEEHLGHPTYIAPLFGVTSGITAVYLDGNDIVLGILPREEEIPRSHVRPSQESKKAIILDLAAILEEAIQKTAFFRHRTLDKYPPIIVSPSDPKKRKGSIVRERIGWLESDAPRDIDSAIIKLGIKLEERFGIEAAATVYRTLKLDMKFSEAIDETDVEQVLRLANTMARSSMIASISECAAGGWLEPGMLASVGYTQGWLQDSFLEFIGKMAELAHGSPHLRLGDMDRRILTEGPESKEMFFFQVGAIDTIRRVLAATAEDHGMATVIGIGEDTWREAGAATLENISRELGFSFHSIPGILDEFERINSTDYLTMENLPVVASVWREIYE